MDSYLPRQISQSDCEISSNCGKKCFGTPWMNSPSHTIRILTVVKRTSYPAIKNSAIIFSAKVIWNLPRKFEHFELSFVRNTQRVYSIFLLGFSSHKLSPGGYSLTRTMVFQTKARLIKQYFGWHGLPSSGCYRGITLVKRYKFKIWEIRYNWWKDK